MMTGPSPKSQRNAREPNEQSILKLTGHSSQDSDSCPLSGPTSPIDYCSSLSLRFSAINIDQPTEILRFFTKIMSNSHQYLRYRYRVCFCMPVIPLRFSKPIRTVIEMLMHAVFIQNKLKKRK